MTEESLARRVIERAQEPEQAWIECPRHEGPECPRCDGSGYRPRKHCAGCGAPSGKPSEGGKALMGMPNVRDREQPMWCMDCHPDMSGSLDMLGGLE